MERFKEKQFFEGIGEGAKREGNVIKNAKILGLVSKNGYKYLETAVKNAVDKYKDATSFADHSWGDRKVSEQLGVIKDPYYVEGKGVFAKEVVFNPEHPLTKQILWWAENYPNKMGFSHDISGIMDAKKENVTEISIVHSVDTVTTPATNKGFFESEKKEIDLEKESLESKSENEDKMDLSKITLDDLKKSRADLIEAIEKPIKDAQATAISEAVALERRITDGLAKLPEKARTDAIKKSLTAIAKDETAFNALVESLKTVAGEPAQSAPPKKTEEEEEKTTESEKKKSEDKIDALKMLEAQFKKGK